jgi:hypothetical protein
VSVRKRLERLEARTPSKAGGSRRAPNYLDRFFKELENIERADVGLPPLPYTEEDREDDRRCLREVIPAYRAASPGWQSGEGKAFLDTWEEHIREKLAKGAQEDD